MIIDNYNEIPYYSCKTAEIRPRNKEEFAGNLDVNGESFTIKIISSYDEHEPIPRVWARIKLIDAVPGNRIDDYACGIAAKTQGDPLFDFVKVDLRDGETAFMKTWTYNYPDDAAMDAFIAQSKEFIKLHIGELRGMREPARPQGLEDLLDLF